MSLDIHSLLFYAFAFVLTACAVMVISSRNSVYSVFFLILAFFNAAGLFVLLGAEYIAMTLVIVYVGAVAVLFLFVVMMLNVDFAKLREGFAKYLPLGILVAVVLFIQLGALVYASFATPLYLSGSGMGIPYPQYVTNTEALGRVLYTQYIFLFQMAGIILLLAMIGAIVLTLHSRPGVRKQRIAAQVARTRQEGVTLVSKSPGEGA